MILVSYFAKINWKHHSKDIFWTFLKVNNQPIFKGMKRQQNEHSSGTVDHRKVGNMKHFWFIFLNCNIIHFQKLAKSKGED